MAGRQRRRAAALLAAGAAGPERAVLRGRGDARLLGRDGVRAGAAVRVRGMNGSSQITTDAPEAAATAPGRRARRASIALMAALAALQLALLAATAWDKANVYDESTYAV